jgi:hypothetical protein
MGEVRKHRWAPIAAAVVVVLAAGVMGCVNMVLPAVDMKFSGPPAQPPALGAFAEDPAVTTPQDWRERRAPLLRAAFQRELYGRAEPMPAPVVEARTPVTSRAIGKEATAEQWTVRVGPQSHFHMVIVAPKAPGPHPVIIMQNFCGNRRAFKDSPKSVAEPLTPVLSFCKSDLAQIPVTAILGANINGPPFEKIVARGYAVALFYAGDVVADEPGDPKPGLALFAGDLPPNERPGALAVWAALYSRAVDVLSADARFDAARMAIWGHSRNGKAALLAAALDPRIAAVIAHQSGKGGATLTRSYAGETVEQITTAYPFWFGARYATWAGREEDIPIDQHQLLALIAPRPVFIGAGIRDKWSDPEGAWRAAQGADPVYELLGSMGLDQPDMRARNLGADLSFVLRPGPHGVTSGDWRDFLDFLDARWK